MTDIHAPDIHAELPDGLLGEETQHDTQPTLNDVLERTKNWRNLTQSLRSEIDSVLKYPLVIQDKSKKGVKIPTNEAAYQHADIQYSIGNQPETEGGIVVTDVNFGYHVKGAFRHVGRIDYMVLDENGKVLEVGCSSEETLNVFQENIFGKDMTEVEIARICETNLRVIEALRADTQAKKKLDAFVEKREHKPQWSYAARLAYYHPKEFDIIAWAKQEHIPLADLYRAGFIERRVTQEGLRYQARRDEVVFIPFQDNDGKILRWRMRLINPKQGDPKYRDGPLDRSLRFPNSVHRKLYQAELLKNIEGKPLVITEGEFKCLVATKMTGIATVGITGITQVTDTIIQEIKKANPSTVTILLDRDPEGKGLARTDKNTDSERAAYRIAKQFQRAGYRRVRLGELPDVFEGGKVGLDDYLLHVGDQKACSAYSEILESAITVKRCETVGDVNKAFHEIMDRRQAVKQTLRDYTHFVERAGRFAVDDSQFHIAQTVKEELSQQAAMLDACIKTYISENFEGAQRISQPPMIHFTHFAVSKVPDAERKYIKTQDGRNIPAEKFNDDVLELIVHARDLPRKYRYEKAPGIEFPYSMQELTYAYDYPELISHELRKDYLRWRKIQHSDTTTLDEKIPADDISYEEFVDTVFMGYVAKIFPPDDYHYEQNLTLRKSHASYWEETATIQSAIFNDDGKPVAFASLITWRHEDSDTAKVGRLALIANRNRSAIRSFLRSPGFETQKQKFALIHELIENYVAKREHIPETPLDTLIDDDVIMLDSNDWSYLIQQFSQKELLNQAIHAGLLVTDSEGFAKPRFTSSTAFIADRDISQNVIGYTVIPCRIHGHTQALLPPSPQLAYQVTSPRTIARSFNREGAFFHEHLLANARDKTVIVAESPLAAIALQKELHKKGKDDVLVIACKELDVPGEKAIRQLIEAQPKKIILLSQDATLNIQQQEYGVRAFQDAETLAARFCLRKNEIPIKAVIFDKNLTYDLAGKNAETLCAQIEQAISSAESFTSQDAKSDAVNAKVSFSTLLQKLETLSLLNENQDKTKFDEQAFRLLEYFYGRVLVTHPQSALPPSLHEFLSARYGISEHSVEAALLHALPRSAYRHGSPRIVNGLRWKPHFERVHKLLEGEAAELAEVSVLKRNKETQSEQQHSYENFMTECELLAQGAGNSFSVIEEQKFKVRVAEASYHRHYLSIELQGKIFTAESYSHQGGISRAQVVKNLRETIAEKAPNIVDDLQKIRARIETEKSNDRKAQKENYAGRYNACEPLLKKAYPAYDFTFGPTESTPPFIETPYRLVLKEPNLVFEGRVQGLKSKASKQRAYGEILEKLRTCGVLGEIEEELSKAKSDVHLDPHQRLIKRLQEIRKQNAMPEDLFTLTKARDESGDSCVHICTIETTINGMTVSVSARNEDKKAAKAKASALLLEKIEQTDLPPAPEGYTYKKGQAGLNVHTEPVGYLNHRLQVHTKEFLQDNAPELTEPVWSERQNLLNGKTIHSLTLAIKVNGEILENEVTVEAESKAEAKRRAATLLIKILNTFEKELEKRPVDVKDADFRQLVRQKHAALRRSFGESVSKIDEQINDETPFSVKWSFVLEIEPEKVIEFTAQGTGKSKTEARKAVAKDMNLKIDKFNAAKEK